MFRNGRWVILAAAVLAVGHASDAVAQATPTVNIAVDATGAGTPLERIWPFFGYDEVNYTTTPPGQDLLRTLGSIDTVAPHIRTHFLLNTGNGTPSLKWGSTNVYTEDASGNPIYSWTLMDGIMDSITMAGTFPLVEIGFMPQALTTAPANVAYQNTDVHTLDGGCFYPPKAAAAHLTTVGGEVNVSAPYAGRVWISPSYIHVRNGWALANAGTEVMHSLGAAGIAGNYMAWTGAPEASTGTGSMLNLGFLYENTLSRILDKTPGTVMPEVTLSVFGLLANSKLDLPAGSTIAQYLNQNKIK
jgi:hypothetical protein